MRMIVTSFLLIAFTIGCIGPQAVQRRANEDSAIALITRIKDAEVEYEKRHGHYGNMAELIAANLLPSDLARGEQSGYTLTLKTDKNNYAAQAIPIGYGKEESQGIGSFYVDDSEVIRFANGHVAGPKDSPLSSSTGQFKVNEEKAKTTLGAIGRAQSEFEKKYGRYGALFDLIKEGSLTNALADSEDKGYRFTLNVNKGKYSVQAIPSDYPLDKSTGIPSYYEYSFYLDESGVIRGAKVPRIATHDDPPISAEPTKTKG